MRPSLFYGTAVSAWMGLLMGLALHGPWESRGGGPQILIASAAADELARPLSDNDIIETAAPADQAAAFDPVLDTFQLPPDPLPVIRLTRSGGAPIPAAASVERVSADDVDQVATSDDSVVAEAAAPSPSRPIITAAYTSNIGGL